LIKSAITFGTLSYNLSSTAVAPKSERLISIFSANSKMSSSLVGESYIFSNSFKIFSYSSF